MTSTAINNNSYKNYCVYIRSNEHPVTSNSSMTSRNNFTYIEFSTEAEVIEFVLSLYEKGQSPIEITVPYTYGHAHVVRNKKTNEWFLYRVKTQAQTFRR